MKILISAYACEPNKGSEPGVGWHWSLEAAAQGHEVWVLTRANNQKAIESAFVDKKQPENLHFVYYDCPAWILKLKRLAGATQLYYFCWQLGIFKIAQHLHQLIQFDLVHHVTFVSVRQPSFLGLLGLPFIFGPVAGGEATPMPLRKSFPWRGQLKDGVRDLLNCLIRFDPLMHLTFQKACKIYVTSQQTLDFIPRNYQGKCAVQLAIGTEQQPPSNTALPIHFADSVFRVLYVGNLLYLKGIHLALKAFEDFHKNYPHSQFTILGSGPDEQWLKQLAQTLQCQESIEWVPRLPQDQLPTVYQQHDVLLFPSLHDSGGMVVLESFSHGLPAICLDIGGPGLLVDETCGQVIHTQRQTEDRVVERLAEALLEMAKTPDLLAQYKQGALARANFFTWKKHVHKIYADLPI